MNPAGILLIIAGTWVVSQVFAGNALQRLNIVKPSESTGLLPDLTWPTVPQPKQIIPYLPGGPGNPVLPQL